MISQRTAKANQIRGLVSEYGLVAPRQLNASRRAVPFWLEEAENGLTDNFRRLLFGTWSDLKGLHERIAELDREIQLIAASHPDAQRLQTLRGVGPMIATAILAQVGNGQHYANGLQMAAALGLTPRQHNSGDRTRLQGISKRGDAYLRSLLIHSARAVIYRCKHKTDRLSQWLNFFRQRRHVNVVAVALANKTARMIWALLNNGTEYDPDWVTA